MVSNGNLLLHGVHVQVRTVSFREGMFSDCKESVLVSREDSEVQLRELNLVSLNKAGYHTGLFRSGGVHSSRLTSHHFQVKQRHKKLEFPVNPAYKIASSIVWKKMQRVCGAPRKDWMFTNNNKASLHTYMHTHTLKLQRERETLKLP